MRVRRTTTSAPREREIAARKNDPRFKNAITTITGNYDPKTDVDFDAYLKKILPLYFYDPASEMPRFCQDRHGAAFGLGLPCLRRAGAAGRETGGLAGSRQGTNARPRWPRRLDLPRRRGAAVQQRNPKLSTRGFGKERTFPLDRSAEAVLCRGYSVCKVGAAG